MGVITGTTQVYVMRKGLKRVTFALFEDGCYCQIYKSGKISEVCNDFADLFLTLVNKGWRSV